MSGEQINKDLDPVGNRKMRKSDTRIHTEGQHSRWQNSSLKNTAEEVSVKNSDLVCD